MDKIVRITDLRDSRLDIYSRLNEAQLRHYFEPNGGIFIAESPKVIERALSYGCTPLSFLMEERHIKGEMSKILDAHCDVEVFTGDNDVLTKITGFKLTRGALCAMIRPQLKDASDLLINKSRIVVLENVVNPTNTGAIFRSAAALGIDAILLTKGCADPLSRRSIRVSMGTVFQIPWGYIEDYSILDTQGYKKVAMALREDSVKINDPKLNSEEKLAIFMGTEGQGLLDSTIKNCDYTVMIPMSNGVDSLNVAAASAVAFFQLGHNN